MRIFRAILANEYQVSVVEGDLIIQGNRICVDKISDAYYPADIFGILGIFRKLSLFMFNILK